MPKDSSFALLSVPDASTSERFTSSVVLDEVPQRIREIAMLRGLGYSCRQIA
jgi:hypothetical protein